MSYISFDQVCRDYHTGSTVVHAADHVSFGIEKGEFCVVLGPSGAGKTTVLNLLGGMDKATSGTIRVGDKEITAMRTPQLTEYRRLDVGFVFQFYNLMPNLTALENVELAQQVCPNALNPREVLAQVGLQDRMNNFPAQLSGGEQQRVSIARALCKNPALLLCDEPTAALEAVADVDEMDLGRLQAGDRLYVTLDTDEDYLIQGTVTHISALGVTKQNAAYYTVRVEIPAGSAPLGASASVYLPRE